LKKEKEEKKKFYPLFLLLLLGVVSVDTNSTVSSPPAVICRPIVYLGNMANFWPTRPGGRRAAAPTFQPPPTIVG